jgi:hypothetical protein
MVGTETTLGRGAAPSLVLALVASAAATAGRLAAVETGAQGAQLTSLSGSSRPKYSG